MITFKDYLKESPAHKTLAEILNGECKPFFVQSQKNGLLFRGMINYGTPMGKLTIGGEEFDSLNRSYYKKTVRKDRRPMSTSRQVSSVIDDWFEDEMGMRARSEAVFCVGEAGRNYAATYGDTCIIIPIGKFIYCWSPEVHDLYDVIMDKFESNNTLKPRYIGSDGKPDKEAIDDAMSDLGYTINGFAKAVEKSVEIMIECDEYYVIPYDGEDELHLIKKAYLNA